MLTFTTNQWAVLLLVLVLGWLLGLLSRSGGARWRRAYDEQSSAYEEQRVLRENAEARAAAAESRLAEVDGVTAAAPVSAAAPVTAATTANGNRDDLALIRGIGLSGQARLNDLGLFRYRQLMALSAQDEADLETRLGASPGTIEQEQWREQARLLEKGDADAHRSRYRM